MRIFYRVAVIAAVLFASGCGHLLSYEDEAMAQPTSPPIAGDACVAVAQLRKQDASDNHIDPALQDKIYDESYATCVDGASAHSLRPR